MPVCWPPLQLGPLWPLQLEMLLTPALLTPQSSSGAVTTLSQPMQLTACGAQASLTASHTCLVLTEGLQPADFRHSATNALYSFKLRTTAYRHTCAMRQPQTKHSFCCTGSRASANGSRVQEPHTEPDVAKSCSAQAFRKTLETADQQADRHCSSSIDLLPEPLRLICQTTSTSSYAAGAEASSGRIQLCKACACLS